MQGQRCTDFHDSSGLSERTLIRRLHYRCRRLVSKRWTACGKDVLGERSQSQRSTEHYDRTYGVTCCAISYFGWVCCSTERRCSGFCMKRLARLRIRVVRRAGVPPGSDHAESGVSICCHEGLAPSGGIPCARSRTSSAKGARTRCLATMAAVRCMNSAGAHRCCGGGGMARGVRSQRTPELCSV